MKKAILFFAVMTFLIEPLCAQQWVGLMNTQDPIGRTGYVGIGTITPDKLFVISPSPSSSAAFLAMGKLVDSTTGTRLFNFKANDISGHTGYTFYDNNGELRSTYTANGTTTFFDLKDANEAVIYKVSGTDNSAFIHLPKEDSKMVIGDFSSYLDSEGHKFIVRGSAKIEGDIITNENIGIGTNSFSDGLIEYRLSVDGRIRAEGIKVYNTWADFVFEADYNLPTLSEVETFIKEHGHLKDIPSGAEVEEHGIDLGEMNKLLLQKVEELTLYVIQFNKEMNELKKK